MDTERYRTARKRIWAAVVDTIVFMPFLLVDEYLVYPTNNESLLISWGIFTTFVPIFYTIFCHYKYGQTIGKWAAGVKVLDVGELKTISLRQSIISTGVYLGIELAILIFYFVVMLQTGNEFEMRGDFKEYASSLIAIWGIAELVTMLATEKRKAIHDYMVKSVVVRVE